jgi:DNA anti-recombination protein RmuC|nr:MAG TPA: hypothetical protein [Caudoviricetes sp.]
MTMSNHDLNIASFRRLALDSGHSGAALDMMVKSYAKASTTAKRCMVQALIRIQAQKSKAPQTK